MEVLSEISGCFVIVADISRISAPAVTTKCSQQLSKSIKRGRRTLPKFNKRLTAKLGWISWMCWVEKGGHRDKLGIAGLSYCHNMFLGIHTP